MIDINDFKVEVSCEYKGEIYSVRDNGATMRHPKKGSRIRPLDNKWTFGVKDSYNGYMFFTSKIRVHQIVATAFHGTPEHANMVVDHIDTNRCNNRPENLRWVTKLENALNNPITRKKILFYCGSIEAFLDNPSILQNIGIEPNLSWMRTVCHEESIACKKNLERWAAEDSIYIHNENGSNRRRMDESIYISYAEKRGKADWGQKRFDFYSQDVESDSNLFLTDRQTLNPTITEETTQSRFPIEPHYTDSLTPSALQMYWNTPTEFPLCPQTVTTLEEYYSNLKVDEIFCTNSLWTSFVSDFGISPIDSRLYVATHNPEGIKKYALTCIFIDDEHYIHQTVRTCFDEKTMKRELAQNLGREWNDNELTFDDMVD